MGAAQERTQMTPAGETVETPAWLLTMGDEDFGNGPADSAPDLDALLSEGGSLLELLARAQQRLDHERAGAPLLCAELLAIPADQREARAIADSRFHNWGVCEELLRHCAGLQESDPEAAAPLARLVLSLTPRLGGEHDAPVVQDLEARAWACVGTVRLRQGDVPGAEQALREGALRLARGTGDLLVDARLLEFEAAVREAQGSLRAAVGLLRQAESRYREIGESGLAARARAVRERLRARAES